jgi:hypothetical protein
MVNVTITADNQDISGHFQIAIGSEVTVPLSHDASDSAVLTALQNLTNVGKAVMLGLKGYQTYVPLDLSVYVTAASTATTTFYISSNTSTILAVGDAVTFPTTVTFSTGLAVGQPTYITGISYAQSLTTISVNDQFTSSTVQFSALIGTRVPSKTALPGRVSIVPLAQLVSLTSGSKVITFSGIVPTGNLFISGTSVVLSTVALCVDGTSNYCGLLAANYTGSSISSSAPAYAFGPTVTLLLSVPSMGLIAVGDSVWIGDDEMIAQVINSQSIVVDGSGVHMGYEGATAYYWGYGYERAIVFKVTTADVSSFRANIGSDWRGTNVQVRTKRTDGITPGKFELGGLSEVQTVVFRAPSAAVSSAIIRGVSTYQLMLGGDLVGNFTYGASAAEWQHKLQTLLDVDSLTVSRIGDGLSAIYSYGYAYTIAFWGAYGLEGIPQLTSNMNNLTSMGIDVRHDTVRQGEYVSDYTSRLISLDESTPYSLRVRAVNTKGFSMPSAVTTVSTELHGGLPSEPQTVILGKYTSENTLSLNYQAPQDDGGLPITSYLIETDTSLNFDPETPSYTSTTLSNIPEVQRITISYRAGDNVKTRGGNYISQCIYIDMFTYTFLLYTSHL